MLPLSKPYLLGMLCALLAASGASADDVFIDQVSGAARRVPAASQRQARLAGDTLTTGSLPAAAAHAGDGALPPNVNLFASTYLDAQPRIYQDGLGNRLTGSAAGPQSSVSITQTGSYETMAILQDGSRNILTLSQDGRGQNLSVSQVGTGQILTATQAGLNNVMALQQSGAANVMAVVQGGAANTLNAVQSGAGNRLAGSQR